MTSVCTRPVLIAGPTASGKSGLAIALAERLGGVVVNADSMQVYRDLRLLTARPSVDDEARVPHALYGFAAADVAYSAGRYARDAGKIIHDVCLSGRVPIITGGTGLYFKALVEGLSPIPEIPDDVRQKWRSEADASGSEGLHAMLCSRDPVMASRLSPGDAQRIVRALEVLDATGQSLSVWQGTRGQPLIDEARAVKVVLKPPRELLHRRCNGRFDFMLENGAIEEVRQLIALDPPADAPVRRALGVAPIADAILGLTTLEEARARAQAETRQYAKRQITWFRKYMISWNSIFSEEMECLVDKVITLIDDTR